MPRTLLFLTAFLVITSPAFALRDSLGIKWVEGEKFIQHRVDAGQGLYAIGRRYNIDWKLVRDANPQAVTDGLQVGEVILIPLSVTSASTVNPPDKLASKAGVVRHIVQPGETLFRIATEYETTVEELKRLNQLTDENIQAGQQLLISSNTVAPALSQDGPSAAIQRDDINVGTAPASTVNRKEIGLATAIDGAGKLNYALHSTAPPGTKIIVRNLVTNKSIEIEVIGRLPKGSGREQDLAIKISKEAADKIGARDKYFRVEMSYPVTE